MSANKEVVHATTHQGVLQTRVLQEILLLAEIRAVLLSCSNNLRNRSAIKQGRNVIDVDFVVPAKVVSRTVLAVGAF